MITANGDGEGVGGGVRGDGGGGQGRRGRGEEVYRLTPLHMFFFVCMGGYGRID